MDNTNVLGVPVSLIRKRQLLGVVKEAVRSGRQISIVAVNARKIVRTIHDPEMRRIIMGYDVFLADGLSVVKAAPCRVERITGIDLMETICRFSGRMGAGIFFYGASEENNYLARKKLKAMYPDMLIAGSCSGYEDEDVEDQIKRSGANIVFVAKGTPLQERWIIERGKETGANVLLGVGGALDVFSGRVKRAPKYIQNLGMEWLYRMICEPKRLRQIPELVEFWSMVRKGKNSHFRK